jgi:AhpD family alkylhydroperoxidase
MAWARLLDPGTATGELAAALDEGERAYGTVLEAWRAVGLVEGAFPAYLPYLRAVLGPGQVPLRTKDLTAIRIGLLNGCRYSVSHRVAAARRNGVPPDEILAVADPPSAGYDEPLAAAMAFAEELTLAPAVTSPLDAPQAVSDATLARVAASYDDAARTELALSCSLWNALSRFHRVMGLALDMPPPPAELDPGGGRGHDASGRTAVPPRPGGTDHGNTPPHL